VHSAGRRRVMSPDMEDVLDLYAEEPSPKRRPLVCFDESSLKRSSIRTGGLVARYLQIRDTR
jgi:hypothetical protein